MTQEEYEQLIGLQPVPEGTVLPNFTVIYFTATWCGPCRKLDVNALESAHPDVNWLKCDVDQNNYTPGYCNVRSVPTFLVVKDKKVGNMFQSNNTEAVIEWVGTQLSPLNK